MRWTVVVMVMWMLAVSPASALTLTLEDRAVTAGEASANGQVVFYAVTSPPDRHFRKLVSVAKVESADAGGTARLALDADLPLKSVWVAVDLATGAFAVATPEEFGDRNIPFTSASLVRSTDGKLDRLFAEQQQARVLFLRPGLGAWSQELTDASPLDADGAADNALLATLSRGKTLTGPADVPPLVAERDVIVLLDPFRLTVSAGKVSLTPGNRPTLVQAGR